ncbi:MAG: hypothetical protein GXY05_04490 [Clostridiales bacterium]|nr:hypothetical protein [Clostridiales bacterium]
MAMVDCPGCKKIVSDSSGKCPNCGKTLKAGTSDWNTPTGRLKMISSALIVASFILFLVEFFEVAKTYVGGLLLGAGVFLHGVSQSKMADDKDYIGKRKVMIIYVMGVLIFATGIVFLIMDLA